MKHDLSAQLAEYGEQTRSTRDTVTMADVLERAERVRPLPLSEPIRPAGWHRTAVVVLAAAVVTLVVLAVPILLTGTAQESPPASQPSTSTLPVTTIAEAVEPVPAPSTSLPPEPVEPAAPVTGMRWQRVSPEGIDATTGGQTVLVSGGDRFLYVDVPNNAVGTSFDGINWTSQSVSGSVDRGLFDFVGWQDTVVGFGCGGWVAIDDGPATAQPGCVAVIHTDGTVATHDFDAQVSDAGIGPAGIVVIVTNHRDEDGLRHEAEDVVAWNVTGRDINEFKVFDLVDGVLHTETLDGQAADYVLSEHGFADIEPLLPSGWFSQDGEEWNPIPSFPAGREWDLIGTEDGFVAVSNDGDGGVVAWHSSNGLDWRELGPSPSVGWPLMSRWGDGAIVIGAEGVWSLSGRGIERTPLPTSDLGEYFVSTSGNIGVALVDFETETIELKQILYSPDGQEWISTDVPVDVRDLETTVGPYHHPVEVVATDTKVMLLLFEAIEGDDAALVWYLGAPTTD